MSPLPSFSPQGLSALDQGLQAHVASQELPGAVALLWRPGACHHQAYGQLTLEGGQPMLPDSLFRIASMTKPLAAVLAMMLVEEGRIALDEALTPWLPELEGRPVLRHVDAELDDTLPPKRPLTLHHLLAMQAGHGVLMNASQGCAYDEALYGSDIGPGPNPPPFGPEEVLARFAALPLAHQPGEGWIYHSSFDLLSILLARVAGQGFDTLLQERLLAPLGMVDTCFQLPEAKLPRLAGCYRKDEASGQLGRYPEAEGPARGWVHPSGATGLVSSAPDFLAFGQMMLQQGEWQGKALLKPESVALMTRDQLSPQVKAEWPFFPGFWDTRGWGYGVSMLTQPDPLSAVPGRYGWDGGFGTSWFTDPHHRFVGLLMIQLGYGEVADQVQADFWRLAYAALEG